MSCRGHSQAGVQEREDRSEWRKRVLHCFDRMVRFGHQKGAAQSRERENHTREGRRGRWSPQCFERCRRGSAEWPEMQACRGMWSVGQGPLSRKQYRKHWMAVSRMRTIWNLDMHSSNRPSDSSSGAELHGENG